MGDGCHPPPRFSTHGRGAGATQRISAIGLPSVITCTSVICWTFRGRIGSIDASNCQGSTRGRCDVACLLLR